MNVTDNPAPSDLNATLADLIAKGYSVTFERAAGAGVFADLLGPSGLLVTTSIGNTPAEALCGVWPLDDDQADTPTARCAACGELIGHFDAAAGLQHWRVIKRVVESFAADHDAVRTETPAAGQ